MLGWFENLKIQNQKGLATALKQKICPLQGKCLLDNIVYQAKVKSETTEETYIGLASTTFKSRLGNHRKAFKNDKYRCDTTLSSHIWDIKDRGEDFDIEWRLVGRGQPFIHKSFVLLNFDTNTYE